MRFHNFFLNRTILRFILKFDISQEKKLMKEERKKNRQKREEQATGEQLRKRRREVDKWEEKELIKEKRKKTWRKRRSDKKKRRKYWRKTKRKLIKCKSMKGEYLLYPVINILTFFRFDLVKIAILWQKKEGKRSEIIRHVYNDRCD